MRNPDLRVEQSLLPVVARWAALDKSTLLPLFRLIVTGEPLNEAHFAKDLKTGAGAFGTAPGGSLSAIDSLGRVAKLFGITRETTLHRIDVGGEMLYSCCALVAHMVPAFMQQSAIIKSTDPIRGDTITLGISAESRLHYVDPETACGSMVDCSIDEIIASPRTSFCCHVRHFVTTESAMTFTGSKTDRYLMTIEDFHEAAQWLYRQIWAT